MQQFDSQSCDAIHWCAALTIDSLTEDPVAGTLLNPTCANQILGGVEYVNFAYLTRSGRPQGPPNPLQFDPVASGKPDPRKVLLMNQGDRITLTMHDTGHGVRAELNDATTHRSGSMTASAHNGFGQIRYAPTGTSCTEIPYDFHPMYDTSSPVHGANTLWAAHSGNVAFSDEIGHFDFCSKVDTTTGTAPESKAHPATTNRPTRTTSPASRPRHPPSCRSAAATGRTTGSTARPTCRAGRTAAGRTRPRSFSPAPPPAGTATR